MGAPRNLNNQPPKRQQQPLTTSDQRNDLHKYSVGMTTNSEECRRDEDGGGGPSDHDISLLVVQSLCEQYIQFKFNLIN